MSLADKNPSVAAASDSHNQVTPDDALRALLEGNRRFAEGKASNPNRTLARLQELGTEQAPFAAVLGCSDSRVPLEILFDQGFGDMFVARVAGNVATAEMIGSLEYAAEVLGVRVVMVLGHTTCGAVKATLGGEDVPGVFGSLYPYIHPAVAEAGGTHDLQAVITRNVRNQVNTLRHASPVLRARSREGRLQIIGAVFDFVDGLIHLLPPEPDWQP